MIKVKTVHLSLFCLLLFRLSLFRLSLFRLLLFNLLLIGWTQDKVLDPRLLAGLVWPSWVPDVLHLVEVEHPQQHPHGIRFSTIYVGYGCIWLLSLLLLSYELLHNCNIILEQNVNVIYYYLHLSVAFRATPRT